MIETTADDRPLEAWSDTEVCRTLWATYWAAPTRKVTGLAEIHAEFYRRFGRRHTLADGEVPPARFGEDLDVHRS